MIPASPSLFLPASLRGRHVGITRAPAGASPSARRPPWLPRRRHASTSRCVPIGLGPIGHSLSLGPIGLSLGPDRPSRPPPPHQSLGPLGHSASMPSQPESPGPASRPRVTREPSRPRVTREAGPGRATRPSAQSVPSAPRAPSGHGPSFPRAGPLARPHPRLPVGPRHSAFDPSASLARPWAAFLARRPICSATPAPIHWAAPSRPK